MLCCGAGSSEAGSLGGGVNVKAVPFLFQGAQTVLGVDISPDQWKMCRAKQVPYWRSCPETLVSLSGIGGWREVLRSGADPWEPSDISDKGMRGGPGAGHQHPVQVGWLD